MLEDPANDLSELADSSRSRDGDWWTVGLTACLVAAVLWGLDALLRLFVDAGFAEWVTLIALFLAMLLIENIKPLSRQRTAARLGIALGLGFALAMFAFQRGL